MSLSSFIYNSYFYVIMGGFLIITALLNLYFGEYRQGIIGYVYAVPTILLWFKSLFSISETVRLNPRILKSLFLGSLFFAWAIFSAVAVGIADYEVFKEFLAYFLFFSVIPFVSGLMLVSRFEELDIKWAYLVCVILIVLGISSGIENVDLLLNGRYRITGYANIGENDYGVILGCYTIVAFFSIYYSNLRFLIKLALNILFISLSSVLIFYSGSLGGMFSLYTAAMLVFFLPSLRNKKNIIPTLLKIAGLACLSFVLFIGIVNYAKNNNVFGGTENIAKYLSRFEAIGNWDLTNVEQERTYFISRFWGQFLANPIFGSGFGNRTGLRDDPHNFIIEILGETGLVSFILFLAIFVPSLKKAIHILINYKKDTSLYLISLICIVCSCEALVSGSIFIDPVLWLVMGILGSLRV